MFERFFGGGKKENEVSESAGHVAVPQETGAPLSEEEVAGLDFSKQLVAMQNELDVLERKSNLNPDDVDKIKILTQKIDTIKGEISPKSY